MQLKVAKTLWGVDEAVDPKNWDALFARIKAEGFDAVEAIAPTWRADKQLLRSLLDKHGLELIAQIHTTGGDIDAATGEYLYCTSNKLHDHLASFTALTAEAAQLRPVLACRISTISSLWMRRQLRLIQAAVIRVIATGSLAPR